MTYVRGMLFEFSADLIATTLYLPSITNDAYYRRPDSVLPRLHNVALELYGAQYPAS